jgi:hypothetical protein
MGLALADRPAAAQQPRGNNARRPRDVSLFKQKHTDRREKYVAALEAAARECESFGFLGWAAEARRLAEPVDTSELRLAPLPRAVQPAIDPELPAEERQWRTRLRTLRQEYAKDLYALSRQAHREGHVGYSYDLLREVTLNDPDHAAARAFLGFVRSQDEWLSPFESRMQREKKVWHEEFGWILRDHVERYERGERYNGSGRWLSADKDAVQHQTFESGWVIRTEHYQIKTNHSLERGVVLARKLEEFHGLFFQIMAGFFNPAEQVEQAARKASNRPTEAAPNHVYYFRTKSEYESALRKVTDQKVEITRGMFIPRTGIAYFYFDPEAGDDDSTLYHEGTHQLLSGGRPAARDIGIKANFWIVEGIACYMESFHREENGFVVGDARHGRLQAARAHFVREGYYVPFRDFVQMGMVAFQTAPQIGKNYSQAAALTHFLLHFDEGRYREALIEHLSQLYSPLPRVREAPESLEQLTGLGADEFDRKYAEYVRDLGMGLARESVGAGE